MMGISHCHVKSSSTMFFVREDGAVLGYAHHRQVVDHRDHHLLEDDLVVLGCIGETQKRRDSEGGESAKKNGGREEKEWG